MTPNLADGEKGNNRDNEKRDLFGSHLASVLPGAGSIENVQEEEIQETKTSTCSIFADESGQSHVSIEPGESLYTSKEENQQTKKKKMSNYLLMFITVTYLVLVFFRFLDCAKVFALIKQHL